MSLSCGCPWNGAADILLFDPDAALHGKEQVQRVEMAQDIALAMNFNYKQDCLKAP
jgi:tryptophanyl-tRNA synthetase